MDSSSVSGLDNGGYWPMTEILEESSQKYKVSWKGTNPGTGKPWPPSWVPKSDCRDQLVTKWQKKVKLQEVDTYRPGSASGALLLSYSHLVGANLNKPHNLKAPTQPLACQ